MDKKGHPSKHGYGTKWNLACDHALYADWFKKKTDIQGARSNSPRPSTSSGNAVPTAG